MNNLDLFFIDEQYVKQNSSINEDVEDQYIRQHIIEAQNIDLQTVLCEEYYEFLVSGMTSYLECPTCDLSDFYSQYDIKLMNDYIMPFLLYTTLYYSTYDLDLKLTNRGVGVFNNVDGRTNNDSQKQSSYSSMKQDWKNKQLHYMNSMVKYLETNIDNFILYKECQDEDCDEHKTNHSYGLYLGKSLKK